MCDFSVANVKINNTYYASSRLARFYDRTHSHCYWCRPRIFARFILANVKKQVESLTLGVKCQFHPPYFRVCLAQNAYKMIFECILIKCIK